MRKLRFSKRGDVLGNKKIWLGKDNIVEPLTCKLSSNSSVDVTPHTPEVAE